GRLPIIVGGSGKQKTPMMAGRFADEYNSFAGDLDALVPRVDVMRRSADEAGRDPDEVLVSIAMPTFVGADDADYREVLSEAAADRGVTPDELAQRLTDRAIPHGPADRVATYVADAAEAGVGRVYLQEYKRLDAVDTERLDRVLAALDES
ncbi:MAG: LLM class flavin-dependent oxidoreductase, partial [Acidimicrobiia bacterium]